ncbi:restriction endonuclease [Haloplasma contractile]|uniref:Restriction endonuclease protein n=1 Tax=Haloplasma contractile SSD-17B TaxID=1033810 RepID=U2EB66_9MOLU|nr:restriction endonuclease [Haloplasma contractile]ERJ12021.1 restriction endonuclease protein [Haloplasma contractile SSD-17B]
MAGSKYVKFYETELFMWVLLFLYTPIGLLLLWFKQHYNALIRIIITMVFLIIYLQFERYYTDITGFVIVLTFVGLLILNYERKKRIRKMALIDLYNIKGNKKIKDKLLNFIKKYDAPTCNYNQLIYFERYIEKQNALSYTRKWFKSNDQVYVETVFKKLDFYTEVKVKLAEDKIKQIENYYNDYFSLLYKHVKGEYKLKSDVGGLFLVWRLVRTYSVMHYANKFHKKYDYEFKHLNPTSFNDYIKQYITLDYLDNSEEAYDLTMFIYYLMVYGPLEDKKIYDLLTCYKKVKKTIGKENKKRRETYFFEGITNGYLKSVELEPLEKIETLHDDVSDKRFIMYINDLLMKLGYWFEDCTECEEVDVDFIIENNDVRYGAFILYCKPNVEEIKREQVEWIIDMLKNQQLRNGIVITNGFFDKLVIELAYKNNITLWNRDVLLEKEKLVKEESLTQNRVLNKPVEKITINEIDIMTGLEFEKYLAELFRQKGYKTLLTGIRDFGVDLIIEKNGQRFGVQAKRSKDSVSVDAVYQINAGLKKYDLSRGYVITNSTFTTPAKNIAAVNEIILWDRKRLKEEIVEAFGRHSYF